MTTNEKLSGMNDENKMNESFSSEITSTSSMD
jgi:hypothetical protein